MNNLPAVEFYESFKKSDRGLNPGPLDVKSTDLPNAPVDRKFQGQILGMSISQGAQGAELRKIHCKKYLQILDIWCKNVRKVW